MFHDIDVSKFARGSAAKRRRFAASSVAALLVAGALGGTAWAADEQATATADAASAGGTISQVTVTARKRSENLQRIPVAVTAQTGAQLAQQRITQPTDLPRIVPSVNIFNASGSDNSAEIAMRGQQASDVLLGVSQPVGLYEDTVNIPHPFGANNAFFDLDRVEVLRGPQGTLYGRNTTAGAINIITKDANYRGMHGFLEAEGGNFSEWRLGGAVNLPLIDNVLALRIGFQHWNQQGFGKSIVTGQHFGNDHDDNIVRGSIRFDPVSNFSVNVKVEYTDAHHTAPMLEPYYFNSDNSVNSLANLTLENQALWANYAVNGALLRTATFTADPAVLNQVLAAGKATLANCIGHPYQNCSSVIQYDNLRTLHFVTDAKWQITSDISLRSITGYHWFTNTKSFDLAGIQSGMLNIGYGTGGGYQPYVGPKLPFKLNPDQESGQWTQEFDLAGKLFNNRVDWLIGGFASWDKGTEEQTGIAFDPVLAFFAGGLDPTKGFASPFGNQAVSTTRTWAVFSQEDIHLTDQLSITAGIRYTSETIGNRAGPWTYSAATGILTCNGVDASLSPVTFPAPNQADTSSCQNSVFMTGPNNIFATATFSGISYLASLNYQITPDVLGYFKVSRGFRGGAYGRALQVAAKPETDDDYELGLKSDFFDHRLRLNLAAFLTNYNNKQVSALACTTSVPTGTACPHFTTLLQNAATARITGFEWEVQAVPFEHVTVFTTGSVLHSVYTKFLNAAAGSGAIVPDASGQPLGVVPDVTLDVGARYEVPVGPGVLSAQMDYSYNSGYPLTLLNADPFVPAAVQKQFRDPVGLLNGRIGWTDQDLGLNLSFWITNITNKVWANGSLLFPAGFVGGVGQATINPPRTFGFTVRKTFGPGE